MEPLVRSPLSNLSLLGLLTLIALPAGAAGPKDEVSKPLKTLIASVRFSKDLAALKLFSGDAQGKFLMGDDWAKGTDPQRKEFVELFHTLFGKLAFPKIRKNFENLDTVLYDEPTLTKDAASIGSTILINHPLKKQELKVKYDLLKDKSTWRVVDVKVLGAGGTQTMLEGIRDDQIKPLMKEGGWENVLKLMRERVKELESVPLK